MMGQAGAGAVGDAAISWNQTPGAPGQAAQSVRDAGAAGGPGQAASARDAGAAGGPGQPGQSMKGPEGGPGKPGESMMAAAGGPGQPGQSMKAAEGGPGKPGESMMAAAGGPGKPGESMMAAAGGPGAAGQSVAEAGAAGGPGAVQAETSNVGAAGGPGGGPGKGKDDGAELGAGAPGKAKADAELKQGAAKSASDGEMGGGPGGPGSSDDDEASELFQGKSDADDKDLVGADEDRPDFGGSGPGGAEDEGSQMGAARGGKKAAAEKMRAAAAVRGKREKSKPINPAYLTMAVSAIAFVSVAALLWFGRGLVESMIPAAKTFYEKTGVAEARPGDGLRWAESSKRLQRIGGIETLVVRGFVSNIDKIVKPVPVMKLQLLNERNEVIQESDTPPPSALLNPGESAEVELRLELPDMARAKGGYRMAWAEEE